jgi:hypothetical protein
VVPTRQLILRYRITDWLVPAGEGFITTKLDLGLAISRHNASAHRHVVHVRAFPVSPADMQPHAVCRDALKRLVCCLQRTERRKHDRRGQEPEHDRQRQTDQQQSLALEDRGFA